MATPAKRKDFEITRPGALTKRVGGPPSKNLAKVRKIAATGSPLAKRQARFFLNVLRPASLKRKRRSVMS